jgi:agmatine/peptidylarginine deiminase
VLEGGALETDGAGTLLATRSSVITDSRNPGLPQVEIESLLREVLGMQHFLWLDAGHLSGDDTDGHIDTLARFADPATILYATAAADDPDFPELERMRQQLEGLRDTAGRPFRLLPLPAPGVHRDQDGQRLPATYANFLIINGAVLLPTYGVPQDAAARRILAAAFPGREIVGIDCRPAIRQNGSLHCLTMQFPIEVPLCGTLDLNPA